MPMIPRIHFAAALSDADEVTLGPEQSHYIARVLRLRVGDPVQLFDGEGGRWRALVEGSTDRAARLRVVASEAPTPESPLRITLAQCVSGSEKMDWAVEKAVELGAAAIQPLISQRSVVRFDEARAKRRVEHWQRLVVAACMQCGRDRLPALAAPLPLSEWLARRERQACAVVLAPGAALALADFQPAGGRIDVLVGPESGLADEELAAALACGFVAVGLGPRILRTETAGLVALAVLQARFGDLH
jgi:16S rRNA (uracil1498-N3)-methyltransferase